MHNQEMTGDETSRSHARPHKQTDGEGERIASTDQHVLPSQSVRTHIFRTTIAHRLVRLLAATHEPPVTCV